MTPSDHPTSADTRQTAAATDVLAERERQLEVEGYTDSHDDDHEPYELAQAAVCYVQFAVDRGISSLTNGKQVPAKWPWDAEYWKPKDVRRNLVRAAALLIAEIERYDREVK